MELRVVKQSLPPQVSSNQDQAIDQTSLPDEIALPKRAQVFKLLPSLEQIERSSNERAATLSEIVQQLQQILEEVRAHQPEDNEDTPQASLSERLPDYPNKAEIRCGVGEVSPVLEVSYQPSKRWIPLVQSSRPSRMEAVIKSFDGSRDIRFADLVLSGPGQQELDAPSADELLDRVTDWLEGISHFVEQEGKLRAKRQGYDETNQHFESQLLNAAVQILALPRLEMVYDLLEPGDEAPEDTSADILQERAEQAYQKVQEAMELAHSQIMQLCSQIHSVDVEELRNGYLEALEREYEAALKKVEPAAIKAQERRLKELTEEIEKKKEAVAQSSERKIDLVGIKAALFEFLDKHIKSHSEGGGGNTIGVKHKMDWALQLSKVLKNSNKDIGLNELTKVLGGILSAAWMYKTKDSSDETYVCRKDVTLAVETAVSVFSAIDSAGMPGVMKVIAEMGDSKVEVSIEDVSAALRTLCGVRNLS